VADADRDKITGALLSTSSKLKRGGMVEILMGEVEDEKNPVSGAVMNRRKDVVKPEQMVDMMWFEPSATETAPSAYYVPASATKAVDLLKWHGIQLRETTQVPQSATAFAIKANNAGQNFEGHAMRKLEGEWIAQPDSKPQGTWYEDRMDQPLARLAFYLLEPASDDGLVAWNYLDEQLKDAKTYPILRVK
jgi:hypothetical protein